MNTLRTTTSLVLVALTVSAAGCVARGGDTATSSSIFPLSPKHQAEAKVSALHVSEAFSWINRQNIPVKKLAPWVSLVQMIESGSEIIRDQEMTAQERKELGDWLPWKGNRNAFRLEDITIEEFGFERMRVRYGFDVSAVGDELSDSPVDRCEGRARAVDDLDEHPGRRMCVIEPTLYFDDSDRGYIFVVLTARLRFQKDGRRRYPFRRALKCKFEVTIRGASIPVDVFYDHQISGVKVKPERRKDEFCIGECEVKVMKLGAIKLPKFVQDRSSEIIRKRFGEKVKTGIQEAVSSVSFHR